MQKVRSKLEKKGYSGIECTEVGKCIRLEGEMTEWTDIVKAGKAAAKFGYKGVLNDISLKGFTEPAIRAPKFTDGSLEGAQPDVLIIGGGVIGCSIARELTRYKLNVLLVDKESDVAMQASSRNDGMIHPGIASHVGTKRGEMNVRGNAMYTQVCKELSVPFERWSNLIYSEKISASSHLSCSASVEALPRHRGQKDKPRGAPPHRAQHNRRGYRRVRVPRRPVLSPYKLTVAFAENAVEKRRKVSLDTIVTSIDTEGDRIVAVHTNRGTIHPKAVINAAGVFSDKIAEMAGDRFFTIHPRKGHLAILDKKQGPLVQRSMGLIGLSQATSDTKGGGVMRTIDGNVLVGPDAFEQPYREDFSTKRENVDAMLNKHLPLIKGFSKADVITYFAGVRAATYEEEFIVEGSEKLQNLIHAAGIQSPGLASAPAIAEDISKITVDRLSKVMKVVPNEKFNPNRRVTPVMAKLSVAERQAAIEKNPDYGIVVCRCEGISRGEIIDAINSPVPATSIDAIKRRVRPGMGRCQGGFCMPLVTGIICEQTGMKMTDVTKSGGDSNLLFEKEGTDND